MVANMMGRLAQVHSEYDRLEIIETLRKFRVKHQEEYAEARDEYVKLKNEKAREAAERIAKDPDHEVQYNFGLETPIDASEGYDQMIAVFERMRQQTIPMSVGEATCVFNNEWDWLTQATVSNSVYIERKRKVR